MRSNNQNIYWIDLLRAICMVWIVCIWHIRDYLPGIFFSKAHMDAIGEGITMVVLMIFTLISGFLMSKYSFGSINDVLNFYKKRFIRFYPLYMVAVSCFYLFDFYTFRTTIKCLLGVALFNNSAPFTLWYMCMLMVFYALTPILNWKFCSVRSNIIVAVVLLLILFVLWLSDISHFNLVLYAPAYIIGLFLGRKQLFVSNSPNKLGHVHTYIHIIAYSSFCAYLFHRVIFVATANIFNHEWVTGNILVPMTIPCAIVAVVITFFSSYIIQRGYDYIIKSLTR